MVIAEEAWPLFHAECAIGPFATITTELHSYVPETILGRTNFVTVPAQMRLANVPAEPSTKRTAELSKPSIQLEEIRSRPTPAHAHVANRTPHAHVANQAQHAHVANRVLHAHAVPKAKREQDQAKALPASAQRPTRADLEPIKTPIISAAEEQPQDASSADRSSTK